MTTDQEGQTIYEDVHGSQTTNSEILGKISKIDNPVEEACFLLRPFPPLARAFFFFFFGIKNACLLV